MVQWKKKKKQLLHVKFQFQTSIWNRDMRGTNLKNEKTRPKNQLGWKIKKPQKAYLGPALNLLAKFQPTNLIKGR